MLPISKCLPQFRKKLWDQSLNQRNRNSRSDMFCKKSAFKNFTKFTGKHLCQSLLFNKVTRLRPATLIKKRSWNFSCELCETFWRTHLVAASRMTYVKKYQLQYEAYTCEPCYNLLSLFKPHRKNIYCIKIFFLGGKQVNFMIYTQDSKKNRLVDWQNKNNIIWFLGSVFF